MNLVRLRYFLVLAEELHFGRAAERLHMAQPPLSQQIRQLEKELEVKLFDRTTRRVELTAAGNLLFQQAQQLVHHADSLERLMNEHRLGETGELRIGFVDSAAYEVMPQLVRAHRARYPGIKLRFHHMSSETQREALPSGDIDAGIARTLGAATAIDHLVLHREPFYLAVSNDHRLAARSSAALADLAGEPFISFTRRLSQALANEIRDLLAEAGVSYEPDIEADEFATVLGLVAAGEGIAVVPATVRSFRPPNLTYLPFRDPEATTRLFLLTRTDEPLQIVRHLVELAEETFPDAAFST